MACSGLCNAIGAARAEGNLNCAVAIGLGCLDLGHAVVRHINYRDRNRITLIGEHTGHADLAAY
jgi:hypothetical protein